MIKDVYKNVIRDSIILNYFYLVLDLEYELDSLIERLLKDYKDSEYSFPNTNYNKEKNTLIINKKEKEQQIIIQNIDHYDLEKCDIEDISNGETKLPLKRCFYSLKGMLLVK